MHHDHTTNHNPYRTNNDDNSDSSNDGPWCYCEEDKPEEPMVMCDSKSCLIQWFHLSRLKLTLEQLPAGEWFCPDCT